MSAGGVLTGILAYLAGERSAWVPLGRVFVLVSVKSIHVPFGGDLRDGLWGWVGWMRNAPY